MTAEKRQRQLARMSGKGWDRSFAVLGMKIDFSLPCEFTPDVSGLHQVGIYSAGLSRVFVDGTLVADAWSSWRKGRTFFEEGCGEIRGDVELTAGVPVEIVIEYASKEWSMLGLLGFCMGIELPMGAEEITHAAEVAATADTALVFVGRGGDWDSEGSDLENITLPGAQDALVHAVAQANPNTVVILQTGGPVEMPWMDQVAGVIQAWYPGQEAGHAIADVLLGRADPGGRLPQTFPVQWRDNPTAAGGPRVYPGQDGEVYYDEGVFVGYRHYDRAALAPLFPFGFGLSYTEFALSDLSVDDTHFEGDGCVRLDLQVRNVGARAGTCVVQVYVSPEDAPVERPEKELKGFAKVRLEPGQSAIVQVELDARAFSYFDVQTATWACVPGRYRRRVGTDAATLPLEKVVSRDGRLEMAP